VLFVTSSTQYHRGNSSVFLRGTVDVVIGIILDSAHLHRRVDRGPPASDESGCIKFKQFWGEKSEMRRFKDGAIIEAVVWSESDFPLGTKNARPSKLSTTIVQYILRHHLPFHSNVRAASDQIADLLPEFTQSAPFVNSQGTNLALHTTAALYRRAIEAADVLRRIITSDLKGFPLIIESLRPVTSALRYTSLFPPLFSPLVSASKHTMTWFSGDSVNPVHQAMAIVAQLQKSNRWPGELTAIRSLKAALLVKLSTSLEEQFSVQLFPLSSLSSSRFDPQSIPRAWIFSLRDIFSD
jgi:U3 small nucleolar RNA-associated protein 22